MTTPPKSPQRTRPEGADSPEVLARIQEGLRVVDIVARQLARQLSFGVEVDDLVAAGHEGLLSAARSYDPARGVPFRSWANLRVRGAMLDGVRAMGALPRRVYQRLRALDGCDRVKETLAEEGGVARSPEEADRKLSEYMLAMSTALALGVLGAGRGDVEEAHDPTPSQEEQLANRELIERARAAIRERPDAERKLLERHYFDGVNFDEAARELGLSKSWASRLHARAIDAVAREMKRQKIRR